MQIRSLTKRLNLAFRKALRLLARPAKSAGAREDAVILPYRGFGSVEEIFLVGRVFHQKSRPAPVRKNPVFRDMANLFRRLLRKGAAHAELEVRFNGTTRRVKTDRRGYFQVHMRNQWQFSATRFWRPVHMELLGPFGKGAEAVGKVFIPSRKAKFAVISDIDDTVVLTGVANKLTMIWRLFVQRARSRAAFPGVAALYRALHRGVSGDETNPMLYVSRGPWSIYEILDEFFNHHEIPAGPVLFLRDWGFSKFRPFPPRAKGHKLAHILRALSLYRDLPFILIGDSGQRDPEIYAEVVRRHPGRILAIYIRNILKKPLRDRAIENLAKEVAESGSFLLLASDTFDMALHAAEHGFISPSSLSEILRERKDEEKKD